MKIPERKIEQFTELLEGLTSMQFEMLIQKANIFYSRQQHKVQLTNDDIKKIEDNCRRDFT
ncbi:hypothetical protein [Enterococcus pallens]|uniref:Uncharacterized protein n=1 Tax=Enterococcus pallens ATCC BAA-351 TaxID=1158607 RepID=R2QHW9_9ENTE|nr:hypothetical protein [Enterococcus pallens]EOH94788.1 hypothetical protein UAU_01710 [Enterococcus pallens ATCC BAA-351]EOU14893.1 hypothetical protein I588_04543 [Enterococcus pallens ATCC BAA-351]